MLPESSRNAPLTFIAFHIPFDAELKAQIKFMAHTHMFYEPEKLLETMFKSARRQHPDCRLVVLTDKSSHISLNIDCEVFRMDTHFLPAYDFAVTEAKGGFLKNADDSSHLVFLDTDILIQENLNELFRLDFDVGITYRDLEEMPFNSGVLFIHRKGIAKALHFFQWWRECFFHYVNPMEFVWWGAQVALNKMLGDKIGKNSVNKIIEINGIKIAVLPASIYNYTSKLDKPMNRFYHNKKILHFKGRRKVYMIPYWEKFIR